MMYVNDSLWCCALARLLANAWAIIIRLTLYHQIISCDHPFKKERSLEELLTEELDYYTLFLASDYKKEEHSLCSEIPLKCFFEFPRIVKLTTDFDVLR